MSVPSYSSSFPISPATAGHSGPPSPGGSSTDSQQSPPSESAFMLSDDVTHTHSLQVAGSRWLKSHEIQDILNNYEKYQLNVADSVPMSRPPSGSIFLYNKLKCRKWRTDGHQWSSPERHVKLKVGGRPVVNALYSHALSETGFHRRGYWLLDKKDYVLVHYLNQDRVRVAGPPRSNVMSPQSVGSLQEANLSALSLNSRGTTPLMQPVNNMRSPQLQPGNLTPGSRNPSVYIERPSRPRVSEINLADPQTQQNRNLLQARAMIHSQAARDGSPDSQWNQSQSSNISSSLPPNYGTGLAQSLTHFASSSPASAAPGAASVVNRYNNNVFSTGSNGSGVVMVPQRTAVLTSMIMNNRTNNNINSSSTQINNNGSMDNMNNSSQSNNTMAPFRPTTFTNSLPTAVPANISIDNNGSAPIASFHQGSNNSSVNYNSRPPMMATVIPPPNQKSNSSNSSHASKAAKSALIHIQPLILDYSPCWDYRDGGTKMLIILSNSHLFNSEQLYCVFENIRMSMHQVSPGVYRVQVPSFAIAGVIPIYVTDLSLRTKRESFEYRIREIESRRNSDHFDPSSFLNHSTSGGVNSNAPPPGNPQEREYLVSLIGRLTELDAQLNAQAARDHSDSINAGAFQSPASANYKPFNSSTPVPSTERTLHSPSFTSPDSTDVSRFLDYRNSNSVAMKLESNSPSPDPSPRTSTVGIAAGLINSLPQQSHSSANQYSHTRLSLQDIQRLALEHSCDDLMEGVVLHFLRQAIQAGIMNTAFIRHQDNKGRQLAHYIAGLGFTHVLQLLHANEADLNCRDAAGRTPLHVAALSGDGNMVSALLSFGVDDTIQDNHRCTALALADQSGSGSVVDVFLDVQNAELPNVSDLMNLNEYLNPDEDGKMPVINGDQNAENELNNLNLEIAYSSITFADMGINTSELETSDGATDEKFASIVKQVQRKIRWWLYRRHLAAEKLQAATRGMLVRKNVKRIRDATKTIQSLVRTRRARRDFQAIQHATRTIQTKFRSSRSSLINDDAMNRSRSNSRGPPLDSHSQNEGDWTDPGGYLAQQTSSHLHLSDSHQDSSMPTMRDLSRQNSVTGAEIRRSSGSSRGSFDGLQDYNNGYIRHSTSSNVGGAAFGDSRASMSLNAGVFAHRDSLSDSRLEALQHDDDIAVGIPGLGIGSLMGLHSLPRTPPAGDGPNIPDTL